MFSVSCLPTVKHEFFFFFFLLASVHINKSMPAGETDRKLEIEEMCAVLISPVYCPPFSQNWCTCRSRLTPASFFSRRTRATDSRASAEYVDAWQLVGPVLTASSPYSQRWPRRDRGEQIQRVQPMARKAGQTEASGHLAEVWNTYFHDWRKTLKLAVTSVTVLENIANRRRWIS